MRTVVVGASSGLGRCIGVDRGRRGDRVALLARRQDRLAAAVEEAGPGGVAIRCDVTDESSCHGAIAQAAEQLGGIDALIYATGIGPLGPIDRLSAAVWRQAFDTNVVGAALVTAAALPHLVESTGVAAFLSSVSASHTPPWPGFAAYNVSKAALDKLVESFRTEYPRVGFTRIVVGDCAGGEGHGQTEFANGWDMDYAAEIMPVWVQKGLVVGTIMEVEELLSVVDTVLDRRALIPSVTITPRPAG